MRNKQEKCNDEYDELVGKCHCLEDEACEKAQAIVIYLAEGEEEYNKLKKECNVSDERHKHALINCMEMQR